MSALNEPRNISHNEGSLTGLDHTKVRFEGSKWVVRDFGTGGGKAGNECRFTGVGKPDQSDIRQKLELQA
jgi:hypothetical protein